MMKFSNFYAYIVAFAMMVSPFTALADACSHSSYAYNGSNQKVECESCHQEIDDYNRVIIYTTTNGELVDVFNSSDFNATVLSHTYSGKGVITFDSEVTRIGNNAFLWSDNLSSFIVPSSLVSVGNNAFLDCNSLAGTLVFPSSLQTLGSSALAGCYSLSEIQFNSTPSLGNSAFARVTADIKLTLSEDSYISSFSNLPTISSAKYVCSSADQWGVAMVPFTVKNVEGVYNLYSVNSVGNNKFYLSPITSVGPNQPFIYQKITSDPSFDFVLSSGNVVLPTEYEYFTEIDRNGNYLYGSYRKNKTLSAGDGSTYYTVGDNAFDKVTTSATIPAMHGWFQKAEADASVNTYAFVSQLYQMLYKTTDRKMLELADYDKFGNQANIVSNTCDYNGNGVLTFDGPILTIGDYAFQNQNTLKQITLPETITSIGQNAFDGCSALSSINIPSHVEYIHSEAFFNCSALSGTLTIPSSVEWIGTRTFFGCENLTGLVLNEGLQCIGYLSFKCCSRMAGTLTIPSTVTQIGDDAFACTAFSGTLIIPSTVTTLGEWAFYDCNNITAVNVNTKLSAHVFRGCDNLQSVNLSGTDTEIPDYAFCDCPKLISITIPVTVDTIKAHAFERTGLTSVSIPNSVELIDEGAFASCSNLATVNFVSIPKIESSVFENIKSNAKFHVTLSDDSYLYCCYDNQFPTSAKAEYTRSMKASSQWGTAILPFSVACFQSTQYQFYTMSTTQMVDRENSAGAMMFRKTDDAIPANTPFVYKKKVEDATSVTFTGLSFKAPSYELYSYNVGGWSLQGTYSQMTDVTGMYYMAADQIWLAEDAINIKPFRAFFFDYEMSEYYSGGLRLVIEDEEENTTSLLEMAADGSLHEVNNEAIVDLQGRRMSAPAKGRLNIVNGKIMMIK